MARTPGTLGAKKTSEYDKAENLNIMYRGCTTGDLEILFRMDRRTILARIDGVKPNGTRGRADTFALRDVAPFLVKPAGDMAAFIRSARPQDMPPSLSKEYWNGIRAKQIALENEGQLWRTDLVLSTLTEVFKTIRTTLMLIPDELERKTALSETQREETKLMIDGLLETIRANLATHFAEAEHDDRPGSLDPEEPEVVRDDTFDSEEYDDTFD